MEGKYAVKLSITDLFKISRNEGNIIMVAYGKCKCGLTPTDIEKYTLMKLLKWNI